MAKKYDELYKTTWTSRNGNMTWEDFDQFSSVYEFFGPFLFLSKTKMFLISSTLD